MRQTVLSLKQIHRWKEFTFANWVIEILIFIIVMLGVALYWNLDGWMKYLMLPALLLLGACFDSTNLQYMFGLIHAKEDITERIKEENQSFNKLIKNKRGQDKKW